MIGAILGLWMWLKNYNKLPGISWTGAALWIIIFLIFWGYYAFFETIWNGQTPGKRYTFLRTIRESGQPVDLASASVRNLLRIIDMLPVAIPYIAGSVAIFFSGTNKRLGDYAAGTVVVKERKEQINLAKIEQSPITTTQHYITNIELVTPTEFEAAKAFTDRAPELTENIREEIAARIAKPIMTRLGIEDNSHIKYSDLLTELHNRCRSERGMR